MAKHGNLRTWFEYVTARTILGVLSALPIRTSMNVGRLMGKLAHQVAGGLKRTGEINLRLAFPEKTEAERRQILSACFESLGRQLGLFSHFGRDSRPQLLRLIEWRGLENFENARAQVARDQPVILFTGHVGAWELSSFGLSLKGKPLSFLVRRIDNPKVEQMVERIRTRFGNQSVDKRGAARPMLQILKGGGTLGLLVDLNTLDDEAIFVDFFGVPASTTFMVAKLALRTNAAVLPVFAPWDHRAEKFLIDVLPAVSIERTGDEPEDVRRLTAKLSAIVESYIRRYPEQWLWIHRRWKTRPPGSSEIY